MAQGAKEFYEYCAQHPEFAKGLAGKSLEEVKAAINELGFDFSQEEYAAYLETLEEMSDEDLQLTAGGGCGGHCGKTNEGKAAAGGCMPGPDGMPTC